MPDRRTHRGPHPEDATLFGPQAVPMLRAAGADFCWLLDRGYGHDSALKLVGDRYQLAARQRVAVSRSCCSGEQAIWRKSHQVPRERLQGATLWLDGYNVLTTIEAALAGGTILVGRDGAFRDMASMHGSYRKVAETLPALELLGETLAMAGCRQCRWLLDRPVSNSGRLKAIMDGLARQRNWPWQVDLAADPDVLLAHPPASGGIADEPAECRGIIVATADSAILDACPAWFNLASETVLGRVPTAALIALANVAAVN